MASQDPAPPRDSSSSGIEITTLFLSAVASAVAAYVVSKIWAPGTLFSAAFTPVIVALVKEGLRKPTEVVANVATPTRWSRGGADDAGLVPDPTMVRPPRDPDALVVDPDAPHVLLPPGAEVASGEHGPVNVYSTRSSRWRWRVAVITGLLGFAVAVLVFTVPELIAGKSIGRGGNHATTFFGGPKHHRHTSTTSTTSTTKTTETTTTKTTPAEGTSRTAPPTTTTPPTTSTPAPSAATPQPSTATPQATTATPQGTAAPQQATP